MRETLQQSHSRLEVLLKGLSWRGYRLVGALMQQLSSVYKDQWLGTRDGTLPDAAVILRDQAEGRLLHQMNYIAAWTDLPKRSVNKGAKGVDRESGSAGWSKLRWWIWVSQKAGVGLDKPWQHPCNLHNCSFSMFSPSTVSPVTSLLIMVQNLYPTFSGPSELHWTWSYTLLLDIIQKVMDKLNKLIRLWNSTNKSIATTSKTIGLNSSL